ncbi:unnamed protein product [Arabidopsis thaliana]|uniref:F-box/LRR-repeat protein 15/At3g58940/PEG3-like LRR domain-containing protein n=1 Tax=Arabidopsis thaliana TaxID=3702 RepID=A0A5S9Y8E5_ARATH|nr:unnamed protein product [Arabidopsis thaliana]
MITLLPGSLFRYRLSFLTSNEADGVSIDVKRGVSLPKLKTLHLDYFKIEPSKFNKLLSGCHALEELVLINLMWADSSGYKACPVTVSIPTLKRLKFCRSEDFYEGKFHEYEDYDEENIKKGVSLSFDNPNLVYLEYSDVIVDKYKQVLACCRESIPVFDNLLELTIKSIPYVGWKSLPPLLKICPSLETLVFEGLHHKYTKKCGDKDGCLCKYENDLGAKKKNDEDGLDVVHDDYDDEDDVSCDEDVMKVFKKLQKLPRVASAKCEVQIKSKNLSLSSTSTKRGTLL